MVAQMEDVADTAGKSNATMTTNLFPALVETFGLILVGFVAGRMNLISSTEAKGLNNFAVFFALPSLILASLTTIELSDVNWTLILGIFVAKGLLFLVTLISTLVAIRPLDYGRAGIYAIFTTQSNDLALGYPILVSIYGQAHPELPAYLYLLAPISLLILNPIGFLCLELGRRRPDQRISIFALTRRVFQNPVVLATLFGIIGNLVLKGHLPSVAAPLLETMGNAFAGTALFLLGLRINSSDEKVHRDTSRNERSNNESSVENKTRTFLVPCLLILLKTVALPFMCRECVSRLGVASHMTLGTMTDFAFLYGVIPTAPSVFVFATMYDVQPELVAKAMVGATMAAAPILFISAKLLTLSPSPDVFIDDLSIFIFDVAIIALIAAVWVVFVLIVSRKSKQMPHFVTLSLVIAQALACTGAILWSWLECTHGFKLYIQFCLFAMGVFASRVLTAILAVIVGLVQKRPDLASKIDKRHVIAIGFGLPLLMVLSLLVFVNEETAEHDRKMNPSFQYGRTQALVSLILLVVCFFVTTVATLVTQRCRTEQSIANNDDERRLLSNQSDFTEDEEHERMQRHRCISQSSEHRAFLQAVYEVPVREHNSNIYEREHTADGQIFRHQLLLLALATSMFVGLALCLWTVVMDRLSGIYLELVFLDAFLNLGQSVFVFFLFGFDAKYILLTLKERFSSFFGHSTLYLPSLDTLDPETRQVCNQFVKHHLETCKMSIVKDVDGHETRYAQAFFGNDLVEWIVEVGLAQDRVAAVKYGRHLLAGRVIRHVNNNLHFYDDFFLYTFQPLRR